MCYFKNKSLNSVNSFRVLKSARFSKVQGFEKCEVFKSARFSKVQGFEKCEVFKSASFSKIPCFFQKFRVFSVFFQKFRKIPWIFSTRAHVDSLRGPGGEGVTI